MEEQQDRSEDRRIQRVRRAAARENLCLVKFRENGRWFNQYGPYGIKDENNYLVSWAMHLDQVEEEFDLSMDAVPA